MLDGQEQKKTTESDNSFNIYEFHFYVKKFHFDEQRNLTPCAKFARKSTT
jgi:hypothetical protein